MRKENIRSKTTLQIWQKNFLVTRRGKKRKINPIKEKRGRKRERPPTLIPPHQVRVERTDSMNRKFAASFFT